LSSRFIFLFVSSTCRHTSFSRDSSSDVCSSDLPGRARVHVHQQVGAAGRAVAAPELAAVDPVVGGEKGDAAEDADERRLGARRTDRKSTRLNSSHVKISYAVFCLKKKNHTTTNT